MPANGPDALETLLIEKYGVPPADASAYAAQIIAGGGGTHESALKSEALSNVAGGEMQRMLELRQFPQAVSAAQGGSVGNLTAEEVDAALRMLKQSSSNTRANAAQAADRSHRYKSSAAAAVEGEGERLHDMAAYMSDNAPAPTYHRTNEQGVPVPTSYPYGQQPAPEVVPVQNVYDIKLQRAMAMRKAALGF